MIDEAGWQAPEVEPLFADAVKYIGSTLAINRLWGFKDPRTIRLLPFWQSVLCHLQVEECYLVVIRNPRSVAVSLSQRQGMDVKTAHLLWLTYMVPNLSKIAGRPFIVADYDIVISDPKVQLERIARGLNLSFDNTKKSAIEGDAQQFSLTRVCVTASSTRRRLILLLIYLPCPGRHTCGSVGWPPTELGLIRPTCGQLGKTIAWRLRD